MPIRVCKKCGTELATSSYYFCGICGDILDPSVQHDPEIAGKSIVFYDLNDKYLDLNKLLTKKVNPFLKIFPPKYLLIVLFSVFVVGGYNLYLSNIDFIQRLFNKNSISSHTSCNGDFACGSFGSDEIINVVPNNVSLFIEGFDFVKFSQLLLDFEPSFTTVFEEFSTFNPKHFAVFAEYYGDNEIYWTMLIVADQEPTAGLLDMINNPNGIYVGKLKNIYVVSTKRSIIGDLQMVESGFTKNIGQNSNYILGKNSYATGQFLIVSGQNSAPILNQIQSNIRVPGYLKSISTQFLNKKGNYLVL